MVVLGTRPEAIKLAPVIAELGRSAGIETRVVVTAQHRQLLDSVLQTWRIVPDVDLDLMRDGQSPTQVAARTLAGLEPVLAAERPDWVLVQGDTTSTMAAAIAAHYAGIAVGHVEAGLRSRDRANPFPEETNRVLTGHVADLHFAPTPRARENLLREGIDPAAILVTGNTVIDALLAALRSPWSPQCGSPLARLPADRDWLLVTAHRRESFGRPLEGICLALKRLSARGDVQLIVPVHPNPNVTRTIEAALAGDPAISLLAPLDYRPLLWLLERARLILTDSGGIQEEAPTLGKPVLVLRERTERPEAIEYGTARLVGTDPERIVAEANRLLDDPAAYEAMARAGNPFGDGQAAVRIVAALRGDRGVPEWLPQPGSGHEP